MDTDAAMIAWSCCRKNSNSKKTKFINAFQIILDIQNSVTLFNFTIDLFLYFSIHFTGVSICRLSLKLPMKAMMVIRCGSLSILLKSIMNRSSSVSPSIGRRSRSYWRSIFTSLSVGMNRIKHSTKSTGTVRRSNLRGGEKLITVLFKTTKNQNQSKQNQTKTRGVQYWQRIISWYFLGFSW